MVRLEKRTPCISDISTTTDMITKLLITIDKEEKGVGVGGLKKGV